MSRPNAGAMLLGQRHGYPGVTAEYTCDLTRFLDQQAGLTGRMAHYILDDPFEKDGGVKLYPIRIPGGTVGALWLDKNSHIIKTALDTGYVVKTYPMDIREKITRFAGMTVMFPGPDPENDPEKGDDETT